MTTKHTNGPWKLGRISSGGYREIDTVSNKWEGLAKVVVQIDGDDKPDAAGQANARLIAASPCLYGALKELLKMVEEGRTDNPFFMASVIENAQAALKAAKGK